MEECVVMEAEMAFLMDFLVVIVLKNVYTEPGDAGGAADIGLVCANNVKFAMVEETTEATSGPLESNLMAVLNVTAIYLLILTLTQTSSVFH